MSDVVSLATEPRTAIGSRASKKLRKHGKVPAIVYGHKETPIAISVSSDDLNRIIRVLHARVLDLKIGDKVEKCLIRELQFNHLGDEMIHADFERISADERVEVVIPIKLKNTPKTMSGGVLDQPMHQLNIECPALSIPDEYTIDILNLTLGSPIHVSDLKLPEGVTVLEKMEAVVVQIKLPGVEADLDPTADAGVGPEVIKKEKKTDDEEE